MSRYCTIKLVKFLLSTIGDGYERVRHSMYGHCCHLKSIRGWTSRLGNHDNSDHRSSWLACCSHMLKNGAFVQVHDCINDQRDPVCGIRDNTIRQNRLAEMVEWRTGFRDDHCGKDKWFSAEYECTKPKRYITYILVKISMCHRVGVMLWIVIMSVVNWFQVVPIM